MKNTAWIRGAKDCVDAIQRDGFYQDHDLTDLIRCIRVAEAASAYAEIYRTTIGLQSDGVTACLLAALEGKRYVAGVLEDIK